MTSQPRAFAAWLAAGVLTTLAGSALARLAARAAHVVPGFGGNGYASSAVVAAGLRLPIPFVEYHVAGGWLIIAIVLVTVCAAAAAGVRLAGLAAGMRRPVRAFLLAQGVLGAALATFAVTLNPDALAYILYGRLFGVYGIDPYDLGHVLAYPADPILQAGLGQWGIPPWNDKYGPLFTFLVAGIERALGTANLAVHLAALRLVAVGAAVCAAGALLFVLRGQPVRERLARVAAFAFNPLVVLETAVHAHNDIIVVALVMWAFALAEASLAAAVLLFAVAVAVKWLPVLLLPFLFVRLARAHGRRAAAAPVAAIVLPAAALLPFWVGPRTLHALVEHTNLAERSPASLLVFPFVQAGIAMQHVPGLPLSWYRLVVVLLFLAFAAVFTAALSRYVRTPRCRYVFRPVVAFLACAPFVAPYYLVWIAPLLATRSPWALWARWFTGLALLYYAVVALTWARPNGPLTYVYTLLYWIVPLAVVLAARRVPAGAGQAERRPAPGLDSG